MKFVWLSYLPQFWQYINYTSLKYHYSAPNVTKTATGI